MNTTVCLTITSLKGRHSVITPHTHIHTFFFLVIEDQTMKDCSTTPATSACPLGPVTQMATQRCLRTRQLCTYEWVSGWMEVNNLPAVSPK